MNIRRPGPRHAAAPLFTAALALALAASGCHPHDEAQRPNGPQPPNGEVWLTQDQIQHMGLTVAPVALENVEDEITTAGRVTFNDQNVTHVFSPVSGRITRIDAALGQRVVHGAPLAVIQAPDIGIATSDLRKAEADAIAAEHDVRRQRELVAQGAGTSRDAEQAEDTYRRNVAELERARARVRLFRGSDSVQQTYTVRSEIDGEVVARAANPGIEIQGQYSGGTPFELFTIGDLGRLWVIASVFEMDLARIHVGARAIVRVVAFPQRVFEGRVDWVSGTLDPTTRTAQVRISLENADHALRPEMYATVEIAVEATRAAAVSRNTVLRLGESTVVFIDRGPAPGNHGERFERVPVAVDETASEHWLPVQHGLQVGDRVVTNNGIQLVGLL